MGGLPFGTGPDLVGWFSCSLVSLVSFEPGIYKNPENLRTPTIEDEHHFPNTFWVPCSSACNLMIVSNVRNPPLNGPTLQVWNFIFSNVGCPGLTWC